MPFLFLCNLQTSCISQTHCFYLKGHIQCIDSLRISWKRRNIIVCASQEKCGLVFIFLSKDVILIPGHDEKQLRIQSHQEIGNYIMRQVKW